jgi:hypothetical protein
VNSFGFQGMLGFNDVHARSFPTVCLQWDFRECWILAMYIQGVHATRFSGGAELQHLACSAISERAELQQSAVTTCQGIKGSKGI